MDDWRNSYPKPDGPISKWIWAVWYAVIAASMTVVMAFVALALVMIVVALILYIV